MGRMNNGICRMGIIGPQCRERFLSLLPGGPLAQMGIHFAGISDLRGRYCMSRPDNHFGLLLGTLAGEAKLTTLEGQGKLAAGDLLLAGTGSTYRYELLPKTPWKIAWLHFDSSVALAAESASHLRVTPALQQPLEKLAQEMEDLLTETNRVAPLQAEARHAKETYLAVLVERLIHPTPSALPSPQQQCLDDLFARVENQLAHPWTLAELAQLAGYSPGHLNRLCRQAFGRPALKQLHTLRMTAAAGILRQTNQTVRSVAQQVGYTDEFAFSVAFKRHFRLPPSRLRQR